MKTFFFLLQLFIGSAVFAQKKEPSGVIVPFLTPGIDSHITRLIRPSLKSGKDILVKYVLEKPTSLTKHAEKIGKKISLNERRKAQTIFVGELKEKGNTALFFQPLICQVRNHYLIGATVFDRDSAIIVSSSYKAVKTDEVKQSALDGSLEEKIRSIMSETAKYLGEKSALRPKLSALKLGLTLAKEDIHQKKGSLFCINHLSETILANSYRVTSTIGTNEAVFYKRVLGLD